MTPDRHHEVLIAGAGPVGMAALLALRRAGVDAAAVDRGTGPTDYPKARVVSARSMALLHALGAGPAVRAAALPGDWTERILAARDLTGPELLRIESSARPDRVLCTQDRLEHVLAARVRGAVHHSCTALAVDQAPDHVTLTVRTPDGGVVRPTADYVVLADGCRGLGAGDALPGAGIRRRMMRQVSIRVDAPLRPLVAGREAFISYLLGDRQPVALLVVDGDRDWILMTLAGRTETAADYPLPRVRELLAAVTGGPVPDVAVRGVRFSDSAHRVAQRYAVGRVVRAGDAAHELPPTGASGLNLGLADVAALTGRLTALVRGRGGPGLLTEYETERRTAGEATGRWARERFGTVRLLSRAHSNGDPADLDRAARELACYLDHHETGRCVCAAPTTARTAAEEAISRA
ncbi:FAD-dependent monooxygenase [Streptomyces sp. NPDC051940]|uniref:FAD-dependent monooxygenase n=1 Tax=Streptomyces sp. NPDC051940 TaxID=3155675 RepID=UPI0034188835